jgi:hypothetical protein
MGHISIPALLLVAVAATARGQSVAPGLSPSLAPNELVRRVVDHELKADEGDHTNWIYRDVTNIPAPAKEKTVVETKEGDLACLNRIDNHPLTAAQRREEAQRIHDFVADASAQRKALSASNADDEKSTDLFRMLPNAFVFKVAETHGDTEKLTFEPNPEFRAHSMEQHVFHEMNGFVVVNTRQMRLVEIAGTLTHGVEFAGGLLGHLDPGGTFDVQLVEVAPTVWKVSRLKVDMRGKVLFFKTVGDQEDEVRSGFRQVPDGITFTQAEEMLAKNNLGNPVGR